MLQIALGIVRFVALNSIGHGLGISSLGIALSLFNHHLNLASSFGLLRLGLDRLRHRTFLNVDILVLVALVDNHSTAIIVENHLLLGRIVEHQCLGFLVLILISIRLLTALINSKLYLIIIDGGVKQFADKDNCSGTEVGEECHSHQNKQGCETRCTHQVANKTADIQTMIATRIVAGVSKQRLQECGQCNRCPNHEQHRSECPLKQVYTIGLHQVYSNHEQQYRNQECRQAKAVLNKEPRCIGTQRATGVGKLMMFVHHLTGTRFLYQGLVGRTRCKV